MSEKIGAILRSIILYLQLLHAYIPQGDGYQEAEQRQELLMLQSGDGCDELTVVIGKGVTHEICTNAISIVAKP
jgi:hypothetical protein